MGFGVSSPSSSSSIFSIVSSRLPVGEETCSVWPFWKTTDLDGVMSTGGPTIFGLGKTTTGTGVSQNLGGGSGGGGGGGSFPPAAELLLVTGVGIGGAGREGGGIEEERVVVLVLDMDP